MAFCDGIEHFNDLRFVSIVGFDSFDFYVDDLDVMQAECERAERRWWIQIGDGKDIPPANTAMISYAQSDYCRAA